MENMRTEIGNVSLDDASDPRRPEPDQLVPSHYALRVGEIDVMVISDGVFPLPASTLATNADPTELAAWLNERLQPPDVYKWALNVVVVRSGGHTVLIDSGAGSEFPAFPGVGQLTTRLHAAGIDPGSVTDVVLTHLHVDHVGGLLADGLRSRLRPDVPIHLAAAEAKFWSAPDFFAIPSAGFRTCFGQPKSGSSTRIAASCGHSRGSTRWRQGWSSVAPAATHLGTAWSDWRPAATG
jgi:glyoxylase-like metal-dependent hydrolase (beta-lactamase superfamily II)